MPIRLIADSCCDSTPELLKEWGLQIAPLKVMVGERVFIDDEQVDVNAMLQVMHEMKEPARSACPSPEEYAALMRQSEECMVVTLSAKLSGSYNAASVARDMVLEETPEKKIHVFDSKSAAAGEVQVILHIRKLMAEGKPFKTIVEQTENMIRNMKTMFVLEDLGNLVKNGRISKAVGIAANLLSICPIMGDDGEGAIKMLAKVRGVENALSRLADTVKEKTAEWKERSATLVLVHCNCPGRADKLKQALLSVCQAFKEVLVVPAGALSGMYANSGGIVIAF